MVFDKLFRLLALSSLAPVLLSSLNVIPTVAASTHDGLHRNFARRGQEYDIVTIPWGDTVKTCKLRPTGSGGDSFGAPTGVSTGEPFGGPTGDPTGGPFGGPTSEPSGRADPSESGLESETVASASASASSDGDAPAPSESSTSNSTTTGGGGGKLGIAWNLGDDSSLANLVTENVGYIYTWNEQCPAQAKELGLECVPMLKDNDKAEAFKTTVVQGYASIAMGFNEVNVDAQAGMDVQTAITTWVEYMEPLKEQGYQLISPSTSSSPDGIEWMREFMSGCKLESGESCNIDGMSVHFYGTSAQDMITYIEEWASEFNKPIWITEYACTNFGGEGGDPDETQVREFHKEIAEYASSHENVAAFFPFGFFHDMVDVNPLNQLMGTDGQPTELGKAMIDLSF